MAIGLRPTSENSKPRGVKSIFARLLIYYLTLALMITLIFLFADRHAVNRRLERLTIAELLDKGQYVSEQLRSLQIEPSRLDCQRLEEMEQLSSTRIIIFQPDLIGHRLKYTDGGPQMEIYMAHGSDDEEMLRCVLRGETVSGLRDLPLTDSKAVYVGIPIFDENNAVTGAIVFYRMLELINIMSSEVMLAAFSTLVFTTLLSLCLAYFLGRGVSRPIVRLNAAAYRMAQGEYGLRIPVQSKDEIGQLSGTLNLLSSQMEDVIGNLQSEKRRLELILASIGEGIVAVNTANRIMHINTAALSILEIGGANAFTDENVREDVRRMFDTLCATILRQEEQTLSWTTPTGRLIEAILSPVYVADTREPLGAVALIRDVSEAQRLEQLRREYIGNISHELRTPLMGIRGMTEPLIDGVMETEEEKQECYRVIYRETLRLEKLISEMLELSRLQSGKTQIETEILPPVPILEAALRRFETRASENGISLKKDFCGEDDCVLGNEDRILQIVTILLDNALDFTPAGGTITVFCRTDEHGMCIGVTDTGCGIDPVDLPYIWERFYKADRSRLRTKGTGLGLPIAKLAVELMGGTIRVDTEKDRGTTFTFTLPAPKETPK